MFCRALEHLKQVKAQSCQNCTQRVKKFCLSVLYTYSLSSSVLRKRILTVQGTAQINRQSNFTIFKTNYFKLILLLFKCFFFNLLRVLTVLLYSHSRLNKCHNRLSIITTVKTLSLHLTLRQYKKRFITSQFYKPYVFMVIMAYQ